MTFAKLKAASKLNKWLLLVSRLTMLLVQQGSHFELLPEGIPSKIVI